MRPTVMLLATSWLLVSQVTFQYCQQDSCAPIPRVPHPRVLATVLDSGEWLTRREEGEERLHEQDIRVGPEFKQRGMDRYSVPQTRVVCLPDDGTFTDRAKE